MVPFLIWCLCFLLFFLLGIFCFFSKKQVGFFANAAPFPIEDVKGYNRACGFLWIFFSLLGNLLRAAAFNASEQCSGPPVCAGGYGGHPASDSHLCADHRKEIQEKIKYRADIICPVFFTRSYVEKSAVKTSCLAVHIFNHNVKDLT